MYSVTSLSFEGRLALFMDETGMSAASFAALLATFGIKLSHSKLLNAMNGNSPPLGGDILKQVDPIFARLAKLVADVRPLTLDLRNPIIIAEWLRAIADGELTISVITNSSASNITAPGISNPAPQDEPQVAAGVSDDGGTE